MVDRGGVREQLFGQLAVGVGLVTQEQIDECLAFQEALRAEGKPAPKLGEVLANKNYIYLDQIKAILNGEFTEPGKLFGETAVQMAFCKQAQVNECVRIQKEYDEAERPLIGGIMVDKGYLQKQQVSAILQAQGKLEEAADALRGVGSVGAAARVATSADSSESLEEPGPEHFDFDPNEEAEEIAGAPAAPPRREPLLVEAIPSAAPQKAQVMHRAPAPDIAAGTVIGGFKIHKKLGEDGFGALYLAIDTASNVNVTIKVLHAAHARNKTYQDRFVKEATVSAGLRHHNIKRILKAGKDKGRLYYASEYLECRSLRRILLDHGHLDEHQALGVVRQAALALEYAHGNNVVHGDLRPVNILIMPDGTVRVADLGLAKNSIDNMALLTRGGEATPFYMAPELAVHDSIFDGRADIYSLGAIYYHCITGVPPFLGTSALEVLMRITQEELLPAKSMTEGVSTATSDVISRMLESEPDKRFTNMGQVLIALGGAPSALEGNSDSTVMDQDRAIQYALNQALPEDMSAAVDAVPQPRAVAQPKVQPTAGGIPQPAASASSAIVSESDVMGREMADESSTTGSRKGRRKGKRRSTGVAVGGGGAKRSQTTGRRGTDVERGGRARGAAAPTSGGGNAGLIIFGVVVVLVMVLMGGFALYSRSENDRIRAQNKITIAENERKQREKDAAAAAAAAAKAKEDAAKEGGDKPGPTPPKPPVVKAPPSGNTGTPPTPDVKPPTTPKPPVSSGPKVAWRWRNNTWYSMEQPSDVRNASKTNLRVTLKKYEDKKVSIDDLDNYKRIGIGPGTGYLINP